MKILTHEEEQIHYNKVLEGGTKYGIVGIGAGLGALTLGKKYLPGLRSLTLPFQTFLVSGIATFSLIIGADRYSRAYEQSLWNKFDTEDRVIVHPKYSPTQRILKVMNEYRWHIIGGSWVVGMAGSLALVSRNKYLTTSQKLVQARMLKIHQRGVDDIGMYAQGITLAIVLASAGIAVTEEDEGEDVEMTDPTDPRHTIKVHHAHKETYKGENQWLVLACHATRDLTMLGKT